ncbi:MAG: GNAT family N-acetyltransferase [Actinomycetes bacterium]
MTSDRQAATAPAPLAGVAELLAASGGDDYVRAVADPARTREGWLHPAGAVGWVMRSRHAPGRLALVTVGPAVSAADLLRWVVEEARVDVGSVTLPRGGVEHLPTRFRVAPANQWEFFRTRAAPPPQPAEHEVGWLEEAVDGPEILELLERWSPRHDAEPGQPHVRRWCGLRGTDGRLVAVGAHTEHQPGVPFLASIVTRADHRGRGYGAAVTAWITRALLAERTGWVTLGMYSDNDGARRVYQRLGFDCDHLFTSGRLTVTSRSPG